MTKSYIIIYEWDRRFKTPTLRANIKSLLEVDTVTELLRDLTNKKGKRFFAGIEKSRFSTFEYALDFLRKEGYKDFSEHPVYEGPFLRLVS